MIGLALLMSAQPVAAEPVKALQMGTTGWYYDDPLQCKDEFVLEITDDKEGSEYALEAAVLQKDGARVSSMEVVGSDGEAAQIGGKDVVMYPADCGADDCLLNEDFAAPAGYSWVYHKSEPLASTTGDAMYALRLDTTMSVGSAEDAVGSKTATYISVDSWQVGDTVYPAYNEGILQLANDGENAARADIVVSGGTTNTVAHSCSHAQGLAMVGWVPLMLVGLTRRRVPRRAPGRRA